MTTQETGKTINLCRWRYYCPIRNKFLVTKWVTTEDQIKLQYPDAVPVPGTEEVRHISADPLLNCTSAFLRM